MYISKGNRRMDIPIFNLPSQITCPNSTKLCEKYCYAKKAERAWPNVLPSRKKNLKATKRKDFIDKVIKELKNRDCSYFRIHESGDFYSQEYFNKWCKIARKLNEINFLAYSQNYELNISNKPNNLILYWTVWPDSKNIPKYGLKAYVIDRENKISNKLDINSGHLCKKENLDIKCNNCLYCFKGKGDVKFQLH